MIDQVTLPRDKQALAEIIERHADQEEDRMAFKRFMWRLAISYLQGARRFEIRNLKTGDFVGHWFVGDESSEDRLLEFQSNELLTLINQVVGWVLGLDLRPSVVAGGRSLQVLRERSIAQILLNKAYSPDVLEGTQNTYAQFLVMLGSCGVLSHVVDHATIGLGADIEVIHPDEIFPFPTLGHNLAKKRGIVRQRLVPLDWLKTELGISRIGESTRKRLDLFDYEFGEGMEDHATMGVGYTWDGTMRVLEGRGDVKASKKTSMEVVKIRELWLDGPLGTCSRYAVTSGHHTFIDQDLDGLEVYCPIGWSRFWENGTFHGIGMFEALFSIHREAERNMKDLFQNIRELDRYGVLVLPQGSFNERSIARDVGYGLRLFPWEPDGVMGTDFKPFSMQPQNMGDVPGRVAQFASEQLRSQSPIRDLLAEKGRVDSAAGLAFLDEQSSRGLTTPSNNIRRGWGAMYRSAASNLTRLLMESPRPIRVTEMSLDMAGAVIDPETNEVNFPQNPLPTIHNLDFTTREAGRSTSTVALKSEAFQLLEMEVSDRENLILFALEEGLELATYMVGERNSYENVKRNILLLYGDGESPGGPVVITPQISRPDLQLRVLGAFMTGTAMQAASPEVVDEFQTYYETLMQWSGFALPEAVPNPDDVAVIRQIEQQMGQMALPSQTEGAFA